jgi:hypothetical protein
MQYSYQICDLDFGGLVPPHEPNQLIYTWFAFMVLFREMFLI